MSADQLANRILSSVARLDSHRIRTGRLTPDEFDRLVRSKADLDGLPLMIDDQAAPTVATIRTRARRLARKSKLPLGLIVVDYLQLVSPSAKDRVQNRVQEISGITSGLKALAKNLKVPVLALSQLSRALESRDDKRPQLSDLRESGTIEQDADVVMFIYREQYYLERSEPEQRADETPERFQTRKSQWGARFDAAQNVAEVIVGKQRHGPTGTIRLRFDGAHTTFSDLEERYPTASAGTAQGETTEQRDLEF